MFLTRMWVQYAGRAERPAAGAGRDRHLAARGAGLLLAQQLGRGRRGRRARRPGVASLGYGDTPTWFDVPPEVRATAGRQPRGLHGGEGRPRGHGHWRSDDEQEPHEGLNKDWHGRPKYQEAYMTAYFATRQWIRAMRTWLGNEPLWKRAQSLPQHGALRHDVTGAEQISSYSGHWQGGGEPCVPSSCGDAHRQGRQRVEPAPRAGRLPRPRAHSPTAAPSTSTIGGVRGNIRRGDQHPRPALEPHRSGAHTLREARGAQLQGHRPRRHRSATPTSTPTPACDGQPYTSTVINGEDTFGFPRPTRRSRGSARCRSPARARR